MNTLNKTQELYEQILLQRPLFNQYKHLVQKNNYTEEMLSRTIADITNLHYNGANYKQIAHQLINDFKQIR